MLEGEAGAGGRGGASGVILFLASAILTLPAFSFPGTWVPHPLQPGAGVTLNLLPKYGKLTRSASTPSGTVVTQPQHPATDPDTDTDTNAIVPTSTSKVETTGAGHSAVLQRSDQYAPLTSNPEFEAGYIRLGTEYSSGSLRELALNERMLCGCCAYGA
ncbi:hypothetical protein HYFRA_00001487 [Hymenoscyphus fraxineus]|uniref:Uncharacterized protein n=1 Tax=Hymenoscyphus fraxineus TaxID=746836 RepID=A0A9N9PXQ4_9HELO|nr:hypothetical protein HYFRA_00001487 [Hymenoscyphus fraxineus]